MPWRRDVRIIDVHHEQVAAHAADGYARQRGGLGCVVTTAGPGCMNAITGIATAFRSESPVLHIGGQGALTQHKMGSLQDLPHVDIMAPITKFSASVNSTELVLQDGRSFVLTGETMIRGDLKAGVGVEVKARGDEPGRGKPQGDPIR